MRGWVVVLWLLPLALGEVDVGGPAVAALVREALSVQTLERLLADIRASLRVSAFADDSLPSVHRLNASAWARRRRFPAVVDPIAFTRDPRNSRADSLQSRCWWRTWTDDDPYPGRSARLNRSTAPPPPPARAAIAPGAERHDAAAGTLTTWHCLPGAYMLGVPKAGTTELAFLLARHEDVAQRANPGSLRSGLPTLPRFFFEGRKLRWKEPRWWDEGRPVLKVRAAEYTRFVGLHVWRPRQRFVDGSPNVFTTHLWDGNVHNVSAAEVMRAVDPDVPLLVMLRDPVARTVSHWRMRLRGQGGRDAVLADAHNISASFHVAVVHALTSLLPCLRQVGALRCLLRHQRDMYRAGGGAALPPLLRDPRLLIGFYSAHLRHWSAVFGAERIMVGLLDQLAEDPAALLLRTFAHLGLAARRGGRAIATARAASRTPHNAAPSSHDVDVWPATEHLLRTLYCASNVALAHALRARGDAGHADAAARVLAWNRASLSREGRAVRAASTAADASHDVAAWRPPTADVTCT
jgi:hypothetical protein